MIQICVGRNCWPGSYFSDFWWNTYYFSLLLSELIWIRKEKVIFHQFLLVSVSLGATSRLWSILLGFVATVARFRDHTPFQLGLWNWNWTWILAQCLLVGGEERPHTARALAKRAGFFGEEALRVLVSGGVEDWFGAGLESDNFLFAAWGPLLLAIWIVSWGEVIVVTTFSWNGSLIVIGHCGGHHHFRGDVAANHTWTTNGLLVGHKLGFGLHLLLRVLKLVWVLEIWIWQRWQTLNLLEC